MIDAVLNDDGMVYYGENGLNIQACFGIVPSVYLNRYQKLKEEGLVVICTDVRIQIDFTLYSFELLRMGFNLSNLLSEFNSAQKNNFDEVIHALSLTKLCFHYFREGFDIRVIKTKNKQSTPDLIINEVTCDLKVRHDQTISRTRRDHESFEAMDDQDRADIFFNNIRSINCDLMSALENRSSKQAECLIFDLSDHFHTWNYHRIKSYLQKKAIYGISRRPIKAIPGVCLIFSPDNAINLQTRRFRPKAFWGYIKYDTQKRELIS